MVISVLDMAYEFYTLESLVLLIELQLKEVTPEMQVEIMDYRTKLHTAMSFIFRDYILTACFGEARHGRAHCTHHIPELAEGGGKTRTQAGAMAQKFTVESLIHSMDILFNECSWNGGSYGGPKWGSAIKAMKLFDNPRIFIDHVFDLKHNGSTLFSKSDYDLLSSGSLSELQEYLSARFESSPEELVQRFTTQAFARPSPMMDKLLRVIVKDYDPPFVDESFNDLFAYKPIQFGIKEVGEPVEHTTVRTCRNCGNQFTHKYGEHYCYNCLYKGHGGIHCSNCTKALEGVQKGKQNVQKQETKEPETKSDYNQYVKWSDEAKSAIQQHHKFESKDYSPKPAVSKSGGDEPSDPTTGTNYLEWLSSVQLALSLDDNSGGLEPTNTGSKVR